MVCPKCAADLTHETVISGIVICPLCLASVTTSGARATGSDITDRDALVTRRAVLRKVRARGF